MSKTIRLDQAIVKRGLAASRSSAENLIKLGLVKLNQQIVLKPSAQVSGAHTISLVSPKTYVGRGGYKLAASLDGLKISFKNKLVLDVGASTGGFTEVALINGAAKVMAVDSGRDQIHPKLQNHPKVEVHQKTDIRQFKPAELADMAVIDVSFVSIRDILPSVSRLIKPGGEIIALVKPQFETDYIGLKHKGVIKNDHIRRQIFKDFEAWIKPDYQILAKTDSAVAGSKGNVERFYKLVLIN